MNGDAPAAHRATVRVPATTANLGPGFDAFGLAVSLYLRVTAVARTDADQPHVTMAGEGAGELAEDETSLIWRSMLALFAHAGTPLPELAIEASNDVPLERGLGSSSAAIVAGLSLARALIPHDLSDLELVRIATEMEGHPDNVAPAVLGGLVVAARSDGGRVIVRRAQPHARLRPVAMVPSVRQRTLEARTVLPARLDREEVIDQAARAGHIAAALAGVWPAHPQLAGDRLHEPARSRAMPASGELLEELRAAGVHAWLSGAGPTVCAVVAVRDEAGGRDVSRIAIEHGFDARPLSWDLSGATVVRDLPV